MLMNDRSKKHHYVPQTLLRRFRSDPRREQIYVFDKHAMKSFPSSIGDAGCENYFNTVVVEGHVVPFEGLFNDNDTQLARLLEKILGARSLADLTPEDRHGLSEVVAAQIVRTKLRRTTMRVIAEELIAELNAGGFGPGLVQTLSVPSDQQLRRAALLSYLHLDLIIGALHSKRLVLVATPGDSPLWISDNPVVMRNEFPYGRLGLAEKGIEIYMPISPEFALGFWCPSIELKISRLLAWPSSAIDARWFSSILESIRSGRAIAFAQDICDELNYLQVTWSSRFLYGPSDDFALAREVIAAHPDVRDVQSLVTVGGVGQAPPPNPNMPPGLWAVFYGRLNHHMLKLESWDPDADCLTFTTNDILTLKFIGEDLPIQEVTLVKDGRSLMGFRQARIEVTGEGRTKSVRVCHQDEALNQIHRLVMARHRKDKTVSSD